MPTSPRRNAAFVSIIVLVAGLSVAGGSVAGEPATPQRPSYSSDTNTTAKGTLELEAGFARDDADAMSAPGVLKWGATDRAELFAGWSPFVSVPLPGGDESGPGDLVVGTRVRFLDEGDGAPSAAFQLAGKLPTADDEKGLGSGTIDFAGAGILTKTVERATVVAYYQLGALGEPGRTAVDLEHGLALAVGHPLGGGVSGFVEAAGIFTPDRDSEVAFGTLGVGWTVRADLVLDAAVVVGLTNDAADFAGTAGATWNLGRIVP